MVGGGQNETDTADGVGNNQPQAPRQGEATQTSNQSDVSGAHNTVIHAGPGSNIYLGHPASVERTGYGAENITDDPNQLPENPETEQTLTTFDSELDLRQTEKPPIAGPEPDPNTDPLVRWTPEGNNLHIRLPKEFCSPNIQSSVSPRCQGNEDTPCSRCIKKDAQIKTLRGRGWHLDREIASLEEKLQKATSHSDKMVEERNSYKSKYNELHDEQLKFHPKLNRVEKERDRMKEEIESKSYEARRKISELEEHLKRSKDDVKFWREKSEEQSRDLQVKAQKENIVEGLRKEVNDLQRNVERYQQQVQNLEVQLEKNSDSKLIREKVQCELDLQRTREDLIKAEDEIKRKKTDLNCKGRALSQLERKLKLTTDEKTAADNKVRSLGERVNRLEMKLQYLESQREPRRRAGPRFAPSQNFFRQ